MPENHLTPRALAARILVRRDSCPDYTEDLFARDPGANELSGVDRRLAQELIYGVVRWQATLDWLIARKTGARTQKRTLQVLLQLGLYQLFWLERIPDHAAVHEMVQLARTLGFGPQAGFVNAILRGYIRERAATDALLTSLRSDKPALGYSHPSWLVARWEARWGRETTAQLLQWNNCPPETYARVNTLKTTASELQETWQREGIDAEPVNLDWLPQGLAFRLRSHPGLAEIESFQQGLFYIQDPSTLLAGVHLDSQPGDSVLDLCAAPGGKTTFIAQQMKDQGRIVAIDIDPSRVEMIRENCARLGIQCVHPVLQSPAADLADTEQFDRVLVDAPCSNTGVMKRRIDLRWRIREEEIARLREAQARLLPQAARRTKPGGVLIYSTCSLEVEENQQVVTEFLEAQAEFTLEKEVELWPFQTGVDGAYVAKLTRAANPPG